MIVLLAALLSGAMFYLSQGLDDLWLLAWLAPAPLLWLAYGKTQGWRLFLVSAAATLGGLIYVFQCYGALPPLLLLEIMVPQVVLFPMAIAFARKVQHHSGPLATLLAFPACWTAIEFLISLVSRHAAPMMLDRRVLVGEDELRAAQAELTAELGITVEGAAAASWAGLLAGPRPDGAALVIVTGSNV